MSAFLYISLLFLIACCFPFVSVYPVASDVQPTAFFLAVLIILLVTLKNNLKVSKYKLSGFVIICLLSLRISLHGFDNSEIGKIIALYVAFFTYWGLTLLSFDKIKKILPYSIFIYFILSCLMFLYPSELISAQNFIIRKTNSTEIGYRGVSTLATEPGLLAGLIVGLLAILDHLRRTALVSTRIFIFTWLMGFLVILMTKSGTGFAYLMFYLIVRNVASISFRAILAILLVSLIFSLLLYFISIGNYQSDLEHFGRAGSVLYKLASSPQDLIGDRSIFYRLFALYVGLLCLIEYPFGIGFGAVDHVSNVVISQSPFLTDFYFSYGERFHAVSSLGYYTSALGFLFLIPFLWFMLFSRVRFDYKLLVMLYLMFSYSIAFPLIWMLVAFGLKPNSVKVEYS